MEMAFWSLLVPAVCTFFAAVVAGWLVWRRRGARGGRALELERRASSKHGHGLFAVTAAARGARMVARLPALSVVHDQHAAAVCGYCFAAGDDVRGCGGCRLFATCGNCRAAPWGRRRWHEATECAALRALPPRAPLRRARDTSVLRLLLRYGASAAGEFGGGDVKEPTAPLLETLVDSATAGEVPARSLQELGASSGVPAATVARLLAVWRTNAGEVRRRVRGRDGLAAAGSPPPQKVGGFLSSLVGVCNHSCAPRVTATTCERSGRVVLEAARPLAAGDEATISCGGGDARVPGSLSLERGNQAEHPPCAPPPCRAGTSTRGCPGPSAARCSARTTGSSARASAARPRSRPRSATTSRASARSTRGGSPVQTTPARPLCTPRCARVPGHASTARNQRPRRTAPPRPV